ncbi:hypothetical protein SLA_2418 [Streptomyces laurentii]|uniref:Uncharacterized protein n=1 Tax=Streptomyces laurentii TaxID=39478 RepID=A0A160NYV1_STRLU|nr:hypothetical protein SLA_2418 [Streptomyces laurentii]
MPRAGAVWVDVLPNMSGFGRSLDQQIGEPVARASRSAGEQGGDAMTGSMQEKLKAGGVALGLALGAAVTESAVKQLEKEKIGDRLAGQLGLSGKGAEQAGKLAGKLYSTAVVDSFEEGAEAVRAVMGSGLIPKGAASGAIEDITRKATDLARTFDQEVGATANAAAQMIRTGMAKDGGQALDILTRGFQGSANKADDLLDTMNEYSTQFRRIGLDGATSIGLITQAIQAGARDSDQVADAIGQFGELALASEQGVKDAFKAIGLDAGQMAAMIGKGGSSATQALQMTLDALRGTKDRTTQLTAATALFGDPGTVMGDALFAMNPASAAAAGGMDKAAGSAAKLGDTLRGNTATRLDILQRKFTSAFGAAVNAIVLPAISGLISAVGWLGGAIGSVVDWFREWGAWLAPAAILIGGITLALSAQAIATGITIGVMQAYALVIRGISAVTRAWAAAQALFNSIMALNPITLVVIALVALGAALVVAYQKSETFRNIVQGAWEGIKAVASVVWNTVLKPALEGIWAALQAVGAAASWLWNTILSPVFSFIWTAAKVLFAIVVTAVLTPIVIAFKALAAIASWLWETVLGPVFGWIGDKAMWLWNKAIKPAWDAISAGLGWLGAKVAELWTKYISPVFGWIGAKAAWLWNEKIKPAWDATKIGIQLLGEKVKELWNTYAKPVFGWIGDKARWLWENALKPAFDAGKKGVGLLGDAFEDAKNAIGKAWDKLQGIAKGPVNFIIEWVYTKGIKAVWDKVAGFVGLGKLPVAPKLLATGGRTQGGIPGKDSIPALLMADEYVVKRSSARSVGFGTLEYINRTGQLPPQPQRFADGGVVGWIGSAAKSIGGAAMDAARFLSDPKAAWESITGFVRNKIAEIGSSQMATTLAGVPRKMLTGLKDKVIKAATAFLGGGGNGSWAKPVAAALGTRYGVAGRMWSSGHHTGTDFPAPTGTAVKAVAGGVVRSALSGGPYGNHITVQHGGNLASLYAHLSQMGVTAGQSVRRGQRIGAVGATGNVTGPHLHLEARRAGRTISPEPLLGYARGGRPKAGEVAMVGERGTELVRFGPGGGTVLDHDSSLAEVGAAVMRGMTQEIAPVVPAGTRTPAVVPVSAAAAGAERGGDTYNLYPRTLDMSVSDLELLQRQRDAQARVRRPR